jgi:hypothetical protein
VRHSHLVAEKRENNAVVIIVCVVLFCLAAVHLAPDTKIGKAMRRALIDVPARRLESTAPFKLIVGALALVAFAALISGAPEFAVMMGIGDLAFFCDATAFLLVMGVVVAYQSSLQPFANKLVQRASNSLARITGARGRRALRVRRLKRPSASDVDEPDPAWAVAFG